MEKLILLFRWFDGNRERLIDGHYGEFALIKDNGVLGYYRTKADARLAVSDFALADGDYLIQDCLPSSEACFECHTPEVRFA